MRKLLLVLITITFFTTTSYADDRVIAEFNQWLYDNGHTEYIKEVDVCAKEKKKVKLGTI